MRMHDRKAAAMRPSALLAAHDDAAKLISVTFAWTCRPVMRMSATLAGVYSAGDLLQRIRCNRLSRPGSPAMLRSLGLACLIAPLIVIA
ncbi:MAG: hypothetical protein ACREO8_14595, partial [Luteimonas sp.]